MKKGCVAKGLLLAAGVVALSGCAASSGAMGEMAAAAMGIPVVDAFLEDKQMVPVTGAQPIDGIWMIDNIQKRVRFEGGRAYAVEGWLHAFSLKIQPNMVVVKDVKQTRPGEWEGQDLPLLGKAVYTLQPNGKLVGVVTGMTGRATIVLTPMAMDNPSAFAAAMQAAGHNPAAVSLPQAPPSMPSYTPPPTSYPTPVPPPTEDPQVSEPNPQPPTSQPQPEPPGECSVIGFDADGNPICA